MDQAILWFAALRQWRRRTRGLPALFRGY